MLSNVIASQHATHAVYGGVVPEFAAREHLKNLPWVLEGALKQAGLGLERIEGLAVTQGPGLAGCLHLGVAAIKGLALSTGLPFIGVDHLEGHLLAAFLEHPDLRYPVLGPGRFGRPHGALRCARPLRAAAPLWHSRRCRRRSL